MTENEKNIKQAIRCVVGACDETCYHWSSGVCRGYEEVAKGLEKALEEIQQYRAIGTIDEFKDLKEKKNVLPIATIKISKEDIQKMVDEKVAQIELDIQEIRAKAIDEFAEALHLKEFDNEYGTNIVLIPKEVDEIAEQMKAGGIIG